MNPYNPDPSSANQGTDYNRFADSALLAVLFTGLAFQTVRFEVFETEKIALLGIFVTVMAGAMLMERLHTQPRIRFIGLQWKSSVLSTTVAVLALIVVISTVFSLSFTRSLWGSPSRAQGLVSMILYALIFVQASRSRLRFRNHLAILLNLISIPICLVAIYSFFQGGIERPGSTTGNPNYLSSWLVMVFLYIGFQLYWDVTTHRTTQNRHRLIYLFLHSATLLLIGTTLFLTGSRAAMLSLSVAGLLGIVLVITVQARRKALLAIAVIAILLAGVYLIVSYRTDAVNDKVTGRLFQPIDSFRLEMWEAALTLLEQQSTPLNAADGSPDTWHALRPMFGYGPDMIEHTQSRFGQLRENQILYIDSFHNHIFDTLATVGWVGMLAWITVYEAAIYAGLKYLGLINQHAYWRWLVLQLFVSLIILMLIVPLVPSGIPLLALVPISLAFGQVTGTIIWVGMQSRHSRSRLHLDQQQVIVIALLCAVTAHWIDIQFGFVQATSQPLWWFFLGMLVSLTSTRDSVMLEQSTAGKWWLYGAMGVGLFLIYGFGVTIQSAFIEFETDTEFLPVLLLFVWITSMLGMFASHDRKRLSKQFLVLSIPVIWGLFFLLKRLLSAFSANILDDMLTRQAIPSVTSIQIPFILLTLNGVLVSLITLLLLFVAVGGQVNRKMVRTMSWLLLFFVVGASAYSFNHASASLHAVGNGFAALNESAPLSVADQVFEAAVALSPTNSRLRLHWINMLIVQKGLLLDLDTQRKIEQKVSDQIEAIFDWEPFFVQSLEWQAVQRDLSQ